MKLVSSISEGNRLTKIAFTPKGGCPLKQTRWIDRLFGCLFDSIHPQGWVPVETAPHPLPPHASKQ